MSVSGNIVQIYEGTDRLWVNTHDHGDYCAVFIEKTENKIELGDTLWWQGGKAFWTPKDKSVVEVPINRIGCSGVNHPLGKEYEISYNWETVAKQRKEKLEAVIDALKDWCNATLTDSTGAFNPINQPQAYRAKNLLIALKKWD